MRQHYRVTGMTCQHCRSHVSQEVAALPGVEDVEVSMDGALVVTSSSPIAFAAIAQAVAEAGDYSVRPA